MDEATIASYITGTFPNVETGENLGYTFFYYGADHMLPFATLAHTGNEYERISNLDRPGVFRLNLGVSRETFQSLFGTGKVDVSGYDFTALDVLLPHPDYAAQSFICVLNPSDATFEKLKPMLAEAYEIPRKRNARRQAE